MLGRPRNPCKEKSLGVPKTQGLMPKNSGPSRNGRRSWQRSHQSLHEILEENVSSASSTGTKQCGQSKSSPPPLQFWRNSKLRSRRQPNLHPTSRHLVPSHPSWSKSANKIKIPPTIKVGPTKESKTTVEERARQIDKATQLLLRPIKMCTFQCADVSGKNVNIFLLWFVLIPKFYIISTSLLIPCTSWHERNHWHDTTQTQQFVFFFSPAVSLRHIFDKVVHKAMVQYIYRLRNVREELQLKAMQWFPNRVHLFSWMWLIRTGFLCTGFVGSKLAQPLIQWKIRCSINLVKIPITMRSNIYTFSPIWFLCKPYQTSMAQHSRLYQEST